MSVSYDAWHGIDYIEEQLAIEEYWAAHDQGAAVVTREDTSFDPDLLITVGEAELVIENEALRIQIAALEEAKRSLLAQRQQLS